MRNKQPQKIRLIREVPKLDVLPENEFFAVVLKHITTCHKHADLRTQTPIQHQVSRIHRDTERFECTGCFQQEDFNVAHNDTGSLDAYVCSILRQGVKFNAKHERCLVPQ